MDKIAELKEKLAIEFACTNGVYYGSGECNSRMKKFNAGFDAAMDLALPVKFHKWASQSSISNLSTNQIIQMYNSMPDASTESLYKFWRENIYEPENLKHGNTQRK